MLNFDEREKGFTEEEAIDEAIDAFLPRAIDHRRK
jgi:hypothetical protein